MEHSKHIARVVLLVVLVLVVFHVARTLFTPVSFGRYGHYRADNVAEQMSKPPVHGGGSACEQCHAERVHKVKGASHSSVQCENCHAPLIVHAKDGERIAAMPVNSSYTLCVRCHEKMSARPHGFPQIDADQHLKRVRMEPKGAVCLRCHNPHSPSLGGRRKNETTGEKS
jgi:cytochrome c553